MTGTMISLRLFEPVMLVGVGLVALWMHVRFPRLQPRTVTRALVQAGLSMAGFKISAAVLVVVLHALPAPASVVLGITLVVIPALCYVLVTWIWLLGRLRDLGGSSPSGGHPATSPHR